jgi:twitching motility protein PilT
MIGTQQADATLAHGLDELVETLLRAVAKRGASDLIFAAGRPATVRVDGVLLQLSDEILTPDVTASIARSLAGPRWDELEARRELELSLTDEDRARIRVNLFYQRGSLAGVLRFVPYRIPTLEELGAPAICAELAERPNGLVLVTGPSGSGKSTTLAAMIDRINRDRAACIVTVEDPIEYVHRHQRSVVIQREIGSDTRDFAGALRSALRGNPDVVLVGEMRDLETMSAALTMAETGHLVFATLHTNDASQAIDRLIDGFPAGQHNQVRVQLSQTLLAVIYQELLPRLNGAGRVAAFEVMVATPAVRNLIKEGKTNQLRNVVLTGAAHGMRTLEADLRRLVQEGAVSRSTAALLTQRPGDAAPEPVAASGGGERRK